MEMQVEKKIAVKIIDLLDEYFDNPSVVDRVLHNPEKRAATFKRLAKLRLIVDDAGDFYPNFAVKQLAALYYTVAVDLRSFVASELRRTQQKTKKEMDLMLEWTNVAVQCENWNVYEDEEE